MNETGHSLDHGLAITGRLLVSIMWFTTCLLFMFLFLLLPSSSCLAASSVSYTYDSLNRLEKVDYGNGIAENYAYDGVGNRTQYTVANTPAVTIDDASQNVILKPGDSVEISGSVDNVPQGQTVTVTVTVNGQVIWSGTTDSTWSTTWTPTSSGDAGVNVTVTDSSNNTTTRTFTLSVREPTGVSIPTGTKQLFVKNNPFTVRGVVYSPVPIGDDPDLFPPYGDYFTKQYSGIYERDLPLISQMGANTIRLLYWNPDENHTDFLDKVTQNGLYAIISFRLTRSGYPALLDTSGNVNETVLNQAKNDFTRMVLATRNHPAVLMWSIGDELNSSTMFGDASGNIGSSFLSAVNELAGLARNNAFQPVTASFLDASPNSYVCDSGSNTACLPDIDLWGISAYRGGSFGALFSNIKNMTSRPLVILSYGVDAYDSSANVVNDASQSQQVQSLWSEIVSNADVSVGGTLKSYTDEWWRGKNSPTGDGCPDNDPTYQSVCGRTNSAFPDGKANEEWWGIMQPSWSYSYPDEITPRQVYNDLKSLWSPAASVLTLYAGWNLVSSPVQPLDGSLNSVLQPIAGQWDIIWGWAKGVWSGKDAAEPMSFPALTNIEPGKGYYIKIKDSSPTQTLSIAGTAPPAWIPIVKGWNFVGYNGSAETSLPAAMGNVDLNTIPVIWGHDNQTKEWKQYRPGGQNNTLTSLTPGRSYWMYANEPATWVIGQTGTSGQGPTCTDPSPNETGVCSETAPCTLSQGSYLCPFGSQYTCYCGNICMRPAACPTDYAPPVTTITSIPADGVLRVSMFTVAGTVSDASSGVSLVEVSADGMRTWHTANLSSGNWSYVWTPSSIGIHTIYIRAADEAGNLNVESITVTVLCTGNPVRIVRSGSVYATYPSLQDAYGVATNGDIIQAQAVPLTGSLTVNRDIAITLDGGYDCGYTTNSGNTTSLKGTIQTVSGGGTVTIKNFIITNQ